MQESIWELYGGKIYDMRQAGDTLQEIGDGLGITRERVRQILVEHYGDTRFKQFLATGELAQLAGVSRKHVDYLANRGIIQPVGASSTKRLWDMEALRVVLSHRERQTCRICGRPLPNDQVSYCSPACRKIGNEQSHKRASWRRFYRKRGRPVPAALDYILPARSHRRGERVT